MIIKRTVEPDFLTRFNYDLKRTIRCEVFLLFSIFRFKFKFSLRASALAIIAASPLSFAQTPSPVLVAQASSSRLSPAELPALPPAKGAAHNVETIDGFPVVAAQSAASELPPADLWDRIRGGFAMEDLNDELVGKWENFYASKPEYLARIVDRSSKYMFYIVTEAERRGVPLEIALLPMIESAFNPVANSSAKAVGIWQFIPSTGANFGMKQDWWSDSRRDIVQATNGAFDYLSKLHGMFGDWQLALASYNWGEGAVGKAVAKAKAEGRDGSYLSLSMPAETRNYLPKLQAVKNIIRNPAAFGVSIASVPNEPYFKTITLAQPIDLKRAAQLADMTETQFVALNPAHNRPVIGGRGEFQVLLPADKADMFLSRLDTNDKPRVSWRAYRTQSGDRLEALAERFGTTPSAIKSVNGIRSAAPVLPAGYHLLVPADGPSEDALGSIQNAVFTKFPEYVPPPPGPRIHRIHVGESYVSVAKRYGIRPTTLLAWNHIGKKQRARVGQPLYVSGPAPRAVSGGGGVTRVVYIRKNGKRVRTVVAVAPSRGGASIRGVKGKRGARAAATGRSARTVRTARSHASGTRVNVKAGKKRRH